MPVTRVSRGDASISFAATKRTTEVGNSMDVVSTSRVSRTPGSPSFHLGHRNYDDENENVHEDAGRSDLDEMFIADERCDAADVTDAADAADATGDDVEEVEDAPLIEHIPVSDSRWHCWSGHVLSAIVSGVRDTEALLASRPGKIGPSRLRQCLAWLEIRGLAIWSPRHGWRATDLGRMRVQEAESALTLSVEIEQSLFERG